MNLDSFIEQYRPDWQRLESAVRQGSRSLADLRGDELDEAIRLYLRVSSHLAEARARFGDPSLVAYLNGLVLRAHGAIYGTRAGSRRGALRALGSRYRAAVRETAPFILLAGALFVGVTALATIWVAGSPEARAGLLPPGAEEAIRGFGGEPADFAVGPGAVSTAILVNNVQVSILGFALGITFGVGTIWLLVLNALLVGVLGGAFTAAGHGPAFWSLILPHGLLEVTAIAIACGAGLRMGWSLVAPGDLRRSAALARAAAPAAMLVLGVAPAFVAAAVIEGYVTGSGLPAWGELAVGVVVWLAYLAFLLAPARGGRAQSRP